MKSFSMQTSVDDLESELKNWVDKNIDIAILFSSRDILKNSDAIEIFSKILPNTELIGCSTSGEIGEDVDDDTVSCIGLKFDKTEYKCVSVPIEESGKSKEAGEKLANQLIKDDLKAVFVLSPGLNVNGSQLTKGLRNVLPDGVSLSGGLAGDGLSFEETVTVHNKDVYTNHAIALGLYGDAIHVSNRSKGGWKPFGPMRRVTKVSDNVLFEIDGKPALDLYKEYLGDKADQLPSSGLLYPFAIMQGENQNAVGLIRTILDIDEENNSLILAGDLEQGQMVCLMHTNTDGLVEGAKEAAENITQISQSDDDSAVICVSCVGRKIVMGDDTEEELDAVRAVLTNDYPIAGFYSYGEISHFEDSGKPELHNQTMTITYISERL